MCIRDRSYVIYFGILFVLFGFKCSNVITVLINFSFICGDAIGQFSKSALAAFPPDEDGQEAKFNLLLWKEGHLYYTVVFPRSKHRPDCYFAKGSEQMLISPGALDMAGAVSYTHLSSSSGISFFTGTSSFIPN